MKDIIVAPLYPVRYTSRNQMRLGYILSVNESGFEMQECEGFELGIIEHVSLNAVEHEARRFVIK